MPAESGRPPSRTPGPNIRSDLAKTARLWGLSLICASVGAYAVWRTDALLPGLIAFLITLAVLGPLLWLYERRKR
jgi:hypothetical protein